MSGGISATTVMAGASLALTAAGTAASVMGQAQQAGQASAGAAYQAQVARNNAILMERNAVLAEQQGKVDVLNQQQKTSQVEGSQRAALAAQGGDVNSGSNLDIVGDTARAGATDAATLKYNAALKAYGYRVAGTGADASATLYSQAGANATASLPFAIGSSLLGGASSLAGKWASFSRGGLFSGGGTTNPNVLAGP